MFDLSRVNKDIGCMTFPCRGQSLAMPEAVSASGRVRNLKYVDR